MNSIARPEHRLNQSYENRRLETLAQYHIMDSAPEIAFDRVTRLAADVFGAPMASISLIDHKRQWFKSAVGLKEPQTHRDIAICAHVLDSGETLVVEDASQDSRFDCNPLVTGDPFIKFYAGAPLVAPNAMILGTLWIGDTGPRDRPTKNQLDQLQSMAEIVMSEMELRREIILREKAQKAAALDRTNLDLTLALSNTASFRVDIETGKIEWAGAYMKVWGQDAGESLVTVDEAMDRIHPDDRQSVQEAMAEAAKPGVIYDARFRIIWPSGEIRWIEGVGDQIEINGRHTLTGLNKDITNSVDQQEKLRLHTRELHHRLRNLFATLQSIMTLTKKSATSIDDYIERISGRLRALNRAQQILLDTNFVTGSFAALVRDLCQTYPRVRSSGPDITLPENAMVSLSLVLNELATNAAKYGALAADEGEVNIDWEVHSNDSGPQVKLCWSEQGSGKSDDAPASTGFGSSLIDHSITRNLQGKVNRDWTSDGLVCTIIFPVPEDGKK
ncbi:sensor histidine kinase [Parasphingorhabdus halotolerans]|uniref:histidine kinase n=1 Tax=Parasphingorhabdus halotolerans TaxID=2725558 RepID=A0A6H2DQ76_9SPHN|nr:HWE histidine kinase domain-containing protein [Parasphingorhabdus halotolerans]QJB70287.1 PAS domain-containing protein [Parasphingorhabdus halotolerans]